MDIFRKLSPAQIILLGFVALIFVGGLLLMLPIAYYGNDLSISGSFFTATSAACVTGLTVFETGVYWTAFGKSVILLLIQIGGMGVMSMAFLVSSVMKRRVTPKERLIFVQSMNLPTYDKAMRFFRNMMAFMFSFEAAGTLLLSIRFIPLYGFTDGVAKSVFTAVSAFCNAGFDTFGTYTSLSDFSGDGFVLSVISLLIICGGLGFVVWQNIYRRIRYGERLSAYTRIVIITTAVLLVFGTTFFSVSEWNGISMHGMNAAEKLLNAFFLAVTLRTAGFISMPMASLNGPTKAISMLLMFIGGSAASTAGGIKTATLAILFIGIFRTASGKKDIVVFKRSIDRDTYMRAVSVVGIGIIAVFAASFMLYPLTSSALSAEGYAFSDILFESFSAFGTVGVTTGVTTLLSVPGRAIVMLLMLFGRVGLLTVTYSILLGMNRDEQAIKYPKANFLVG